MDVGETDAHMSRRGQIVWVVMHYEIMGPPENIRVDSVQFHVSSTLVEAEVYLRAMSVDSHSWWQVHPYIIDSNEFDEGEEVYYYTHRGTQLKTAPVSRAIAAYRQRPACRPEFDLPKPTDE